MPPKSDKRTRVDKIRKTPLEPTRELPPVSWTSKLKSKKQEAFHVYQSGIKT